MYEIRVSDPFDDINAHEISDVSTVNESGLSSASRYVSVCSNDDENDEEEWVDENEEDLSRNIFDKDDKKWMF